MRKRTINNYYLTIKNENEVYDFSQDGFNLYYFSKTSDKAIEELLNEVNYKFITESGVVIYITQEPNSNNDDNRKAEINRLLRNLPKYTGLVNKKEVDKIMYNIKKVI